MRGKPVRKRLPVIVSRLTPEQEAFIRDRLLNSPFLMGAIAAKASRMRGPKVSHAIVSNRMRDLRKEGHVRPRESEERLSERKRTGKVTTLAQDKAIRKLLLTTTLYQHEIAGEVSKLGPSITKSVVRGHLERLRTQGLARPEGVKKRAVRSRSVSDATVQEAWSLSDTGGLSRKEAAKRVGIGRTTFYTRKPEGTSISQRTWFEPYLARRRRNKMDLTERLLKVGLRTRKRTVSKTKRFITEREAAEIVKRDRSYVSRIWAELGMNELRRRATAQFVVALYIQGLFPAQIAELAQLSIRRTREILRQNGLKSQSRSAESLKLTDTQLGHIHRALTQTHQSMGQIAKNVSRFQGAKVTPAIVGWVCVHAGIDRYGATAKQSGVSEKLRDLFDSGSMEHEIFLRAMLAKRMDRQRIDPALINGTGASVFRLLEHEGIISVLNNAGRPTLYITDTARLRALLE